MQTSSLLLSNASSLLLSNSSSLLLSNSSQLVLNASSSLLLFLSGFDFSPLQRALLFVSVLLWYALIVAGNAVIIGVVVVQKSMHAPMYVFLCSLCANALYGTLGFYPRFLWDLLRCGPRAPCAVTYAECLLQGYVVHSSTCAEFSMLTLMAYDRYVAICRPLSYLAVMTRARVAVLVLLSWLVPLVAMFMNTATMLGRALCGVRVRRLYCVNWMVTLLACALPVANVAVGYFNILFYFGHFLFVLCSYLRLVRTCLASRESTRRFTHTCVPHLLSLGVFSFSMLLDLLYMRFGSANISQHATNFFAIEFLLVPPLANPLIYGLQLRRVRTALRLLLRLPEKGGEEGRD